MSQTSKESYEFSGFHLDIPERLLTQYGQRIAITDKAFDTLRILVEQAGHLVTKHDLMSMVWPDIFVEENNLDKSVSLIRQALGERHGKQKFIETVRGHGYRFVAEVRRIDSAQMKNAPVTTDPSITNVEAPEEYVSQRWSLSVRNLQALKKPWIALGIVAILVVGFGWRWSQLEKEKKPAFPIQKIGSLALMPLKNLSGNVREDYFVDGMTEELITKLAHISRLRVISLTSVMEYKGTRKKIPEIGKELKVDAILEGSVLQTGNRVRITVQLIHAATDVHLWAESYERDLKDVLILQNEVASAIAREVQAKITPEKSHQFTNAPQVNPQAYEAYLRGLYYADREITEENLRLTAQMFEKAVELDSTFALAHAQLSRAHSFLFFTFDPNPDRLTRSKIAVDKAFELHPGFAEGHLALACYYYWGFRDYHRALEKLDLAQKEMPNDKFILGLQGAIYRRLGRWDEALAAEENVIALNPRHAMTMFDIGYTLMVLRRYAEAQNYFDRSISLAPDEQNAYFSSMRNQILWKGDSVAARKILDKAPERKNDRLVEQRYWIEFSDRKYDAALQVLFSPQADPLRKYILAGVAYRHLGKHKLAHESFQSARNKIVKQLHQTDTDYNLRSLLGLSLAGLGQKEEAIREGKNAVDLLPMNKDALWGSQPIIDLAMIYVMVNEPDAAIEQLEYLLSIPSLISVASLNIDPWWDPLRNHPRFKRLLAAYSKS